MELRKDTRELEEKEEALEIEVEKKIVEERESSKKSALELFQKEHYLMCLEKEKMINSDCKAAVDYNQEKINEVRIYDSKIMDEK